MCSYPQHLPIAQTSAPARPWTWREVAGSEVGGQVCRVGHVAGAGRLGPQPGGGLCRGEAPAGSPGPGDLAWGLAQEGQSRLTARQAKAHAMPVATTGTVGYVALSQLGGGGDAFQQSVRRQRGHAFTGEPRGNLAGHGLPQTFCVLAVACEALAVTFLFVEHFFFELGLSGDVG